MRALVIDQGNVTEIDLPVGNDNEPTLKGMYNALGCDVFCSAGYPDEHHAALVDDIGLFKDNQQAHIVDWHPQPLAGRILVTGFDHRTGESRPATMSVADLKAHIRARGTIGIG